MKNNAKTVVKLHKLLSFNLVTFMISLELFLSGEFFVDKKFK